MTHTAKHTPGPWVVNTFIVNGQHKLEVLDATGANACIQANANLIAAAPAMYEALQSILDSENSTLGDGGSILGDDYRSLLQAALAQAEGR